MHLLHSSVHALACRLEDFSHGDAIDLANAKSQGNQKLGVNKAFYTVFRGSTNTPLSAL